MELWDHTSSACCSTRLPSGDKKGFQVKWYALFLFLSSLPLRPIFLSSTSSLLSFVFTSPLHCPAPRHSVFFSCSSFCPHLSLFCLVIIILTVLFLEHRTNYYVKVCYGGDAQTQPVCVAYDACGHQMGDNWEDPWQEGGEKGGRQCALVAFICGAFAIYWGEV